MKMFVEMPKNSIDIHKKNSTKKQWKVWESLAVI